MQLFTKTSRLVLRRFTMGDVDNLVELDGDPAVMRFLTGGQATAREVIKTETLPTWLGYYERFAALGYWAAQEKLTGEFVGWFSLRPVVGDSSIEAELGYRLRRSTWGKGYATEVSRALLRSAFADSRVERVFATTMAVNTASRRVMEKIGLRFIRTFHQSWPDQIEGNELGDVEYALTLDVWKQRVEPHV